MALQTASVFKGDTITLASGASLTVTLSGFASVIGCLVGGKSSGGGAAFYDQLTTTSVTIYNGSDYTEVISYLVYGS